MLIFVVWFLITTENYTKRCCHSSIHLNQIKPLIRIRFCRVNARMGAKPLLLRIKDASVNGVLHSMTSSMKRSRHDNQVTTDRYSVKRAKHPCGQTAKQHHQHACMNNVYMYINTQPRHMRYYIELDEHIVRNLAGLHCDTLNITQIVFHLYSSNTIFKNLSQIIISNILFVSVVSRNPSLIFGQNVSHFRNDNYLFKMTMSIYFCHTSFLYEMLRKFFLH